ncbi:MULTISPECIES: IclR family transcriptional regulator [unclassified Leucobacter]|uniref:IclR family transcriptional regulator n=1 Tax=unclassified Leucobacter TaxID=2621730 RepID=UPI00165E48EB|nr:MULTISPECIES: helix-turn-helix domain-containing protein [unclassified Leucobacter]MBC9926573.1 helix-turn-helix domain-containing protein [Leucobacter sp. cx-169]MBC9937174.1 helix-turn-helix domain-containing protein [Leucobacter sp. cx-87]
MVATPESPAPARAAVDGSRSQTLSRGLEALEILADAGSPMSIADLAAGLGLHRSNAYRILRTLEDHRFVLRDAAGLIRLGPKIALLAHGVSSSLQQAARPELTGVANELGATAFVAVLDYDSVLTLLSAEPDRAHAAIAQRPGTRHPIGLGAPSHAIESILTPTERAAFPEGTVPSRKPLDAGYAISQDEVIPGLTSIAVPLRLTGEPAAAIAIVYVGLSLSNEAIAERLRLAASRITTTLGSLARG